jgi:hypothetical protein
MIPAASAQGMLIGREGKAEADLSLVESRKVRFYIDQIQEFEYHLSLRGWLFSETNLIRALFLIQGADDNRPSPVLYQLERTDVFHHFNHRNAISSGFSDQLEKLSTGEVDLFLEIVFDDGARTRIGIGTATFSAPGLTQLDAHLLSNKSVFVSRLAQQQQEAHKTVGIYTNSKGNYFFHEIKRLLVAGMESIGYQALDLTELDGFAKAATFHIVIAPHEFFQLGAGVKLARKTPKGLILLNTEQPSSEWFKVCTEYFRQAVEIWDMNYYSWQRMQASLPTARYVPLSYLPDFPLFGEIPRLPENYCTCFLERHILENSYLHAPFEERPIDILFVGHASPRRQQFFARNAEFFARYNCYFHLTDLSLGPVLENPTSMNTATAIGLAQRSKIVLNIHHGSQTYFEWHRMVIHGMWQRALVISDLCSESPPFEPDRDFMQDSLDGLPDLLAFFLSHPDGPGEANRIIRSAHHKLTTQCDLRNILQKVMMSWQEYPEKIRSFRQKSVQE